MGKVDKALTEEAAPPGGKSEKNKVFNQRVETIKTNKSQKTSLSARTTLVLNILYVYKTPKRHFG